MISTTQIVSAGLLTGFSIAGTGMIVGWNPRATTTASVLSCILNISWRALAKILPLSQDSVPTPSLADLACLPPGPSGHASWGESYHDWALARHSSCSPAGWARSSSTSSSCSSQPAWRRTNA